MSEVGGDQYGTFGPSAAGSVPETTQGSGGLRYVKYMVVLAVAFATTFGASSPTQNILSSEYEEQGYWTLSMFFLGMMITAPFCPAIVPVIGARRGMALGALLFLLFQIANAVATYSVAKSERKEHSDFLYGLLLPAGFIMGVGGALVWTSQGVYTTRCAAQGKDANHYLGNFNGAFFGLFMLSDVGVNALVGAMFEGKVPVELLFTIFVGVSAMGFFLFCCLKNVTKQGMSADYEPLTPRLEQVLPQSVWEIRLTKIKDGVVYFFTNGADVIVKTWGLFHEKRLWLLVPVFVVNGYSQGYIQGDFTHDGVVPILGEEEVHYSMAVFGLTAGLSSFALGYISDTVGNMLCLVIAVLSTCIPTTYYMVPWLFDAIALMEKDTFVYFNAALFGVSDAAWNVVATSLLGTFEDKLEVAFAAFKLFQGGSCAIILFLGPMIPMVLKSLSVNVVTVVALISLLYYHVKISSINLRDTKKE